MTHRRDFVKQAGALAAVACVQPDLLLAAPVAYKAGIQLYSLRDYIGQDPKSVLAKVVKAGYQEVETYGYSPEKHFWGLKPAEFKAVLAAHGLTTPSGHYDLGSYLRAGDEAHSSRESPLGRPLSSATTNWRGTVHATMGLGRSLCPLP